MRKEGNINTDETQAGRHLLRRQIGYFSNNPKNPTLPIRVGKADELDLTAATRLTRTSRRIEFFAKIQGLFEVNTLPYKMIGRSIARMIRPIRIEDERKKQENRFREQSDAAFRRTYLD